MNLLQFLSTHVNGEPVDYQIQVNYKVVKLENADQVSLEDGDIIRLSKPLEAPIQWIVGEEDEDEVTG